jgi:hypothetical protein
MLSQGGNPRPVSVRASGFGHSTRYLRPAPLGRLALVAPDGSVVLPVELQCQLWDRAVTSRSRPGAVGRDSRLSGLSDGKTGPLTRFDELPAAACLAQARMVSAQVVRPGPNRRAINREPSPLPTKSARRLDVAEAGNSTEPRVAHLADHGQHDVPSSPSAGATARRHADGPALSPDPPWPQPLRIRAHDV